jgi:hypothetical protein
MILLDSIENDFKFKKLSYNELKCLSEKLGTEVKHEYITLYDFKELQNFINNVTSDSYEDSTFVLEGVVLEDQNNRMIKIKFPYYNLWKKMRGVLDTFNKKKEVKLSNLFDAEENYIYAFIKSKGIGKYNNIINVRDDYEASKK